MMAMLADCPLTDAESWFIEDVFSSVWQGGIGCSDTDEETQGALLSIAEALKHMVPGIGMGGRMAVDYLGSGESYECIILGRAGDSELEVIEKR